MVTNDDVLPIIIRRLSLDENDRPLMLLVETYIDEIGQRIKNYCRISSIPDGLLYTWASMVILALQAEQSNIGAIGESVAGGDNVKIGDTSIAPVNDSGMSARQKLYDGLFIGLQSDLNRFRRLGVLGR
jgi:hypothetical protein